MTVAELIAALQNLPNQEDVIRAPFAHGIDNMGPAELHLTRAGLLIAGSD